MGVVPSIITPGTVKKQATGDGKAQKPAIFAALPSEFRTKIVDAGYKKTTGMYDIADAYWIATCVRLARARRDSANQRLE